MSGSENMIIRRTDRWEVRCWYQHSDIPNRIKSRQLDHFELRRYPAGKDHGQAPDAETVVLRWSDPATKKPLAITHHYESPGGSIGASGLLDPMMVLIGYIRYDAHDGPDKGARDLCDILPKWNRGWMRRRYGDLRHFICDRTGPLWASRFSRWCVPILRVFAMPFDRYLLTKRVVTPFRRGKSYAFGRIKKPFYVFFR